MYKVRIWIVGRRRDDWLEKGVEDYLRRMRGTMHVETVWVKDDKQLELQLAKEPMYWCLDPQGKVVTSDLWASQLEQSLTDQGGQIALVIGGAEGLSASVKKKARFVVSFSALTFPHRICRLLLAEQLYRATQIWRKTPYHK